MASATPRPLGLPTRGPAVITTPKGVKTTTPVHFNASGVFSSSGGSVNVEALRNNTGRPVELLELKFMLVPAAAAGTPGIASAVITGAAIGCQLSINNQIPVSIKTLPIWSFARSYNMILEMGLNLVEGSCFFSYKLPRPLYLRPGDILTPQLSTLQQSNTTITAYVGYSGRMITSPSRTPKTIAVPYVSCYSSKVFDAYGAADSDASTESDITNPFPTPLHIQRFVGRINQLDNAGSLNGYHEYDNGYADIGSQLFQVRMFSAKGAALVPNFSTFNSVFSRMTRSWECEHDMEPGDYYLTELNKLAPTRNASAGLYFAQLFVSALGWREVALS